MQQTPYSCSRPEWLTRHQDYRRKGFHDIWLWHPAIGVPPIVHDSNQPGWLLDTDTQRIGLVCAKPHRRREQWWNDPHQDHYILHWPACPGDRLTTRWMPLHTFTVSTNGITLSPAFLEKLAEDARHLQADAAAARAEQQHPKPIPHVRPAPAISITSPRRAKPAGTHLAQRIDALPPTSNPNNRRYWCATCNYLTGQDLEHSPIPHRIAQPDQLITREDLTPDLAFRPNTEPLHTPRRPLHRLQTHGHHAGNEIENVARVTDITRPIVRVLNDSERAVGLDLVSVDQPSDGPPRPRAYARAPV